MNLLHLLKSKKFLLSATVSLFSVAAFSADYTVDSAETDTQTLENGDTLAITKDGSISVSNKNAVSATNSFTLTNRGAMTVINAATFYGINADGSTGSDVTASVINYGTIAVSGGSNAIGISIVGYDNGNTVENFGSIDVNGGISATGIKVTGSADNLIITNGGIIKASGGESNTALLLTGNDSNTLTVNYHTSGYLVGAINYDDPGSAVFNFIDSGVDRSHFITVDDGDIPTFSYGGLPGVTNSNKSAVVSRTAFARANEVTSMAANSINNAVYTRLTDLNCSSTAQNDDNNTWVNILGNYKESPKTGSTIATRSSVGGVVVGKDADFNNDMKVGFYLGGINGSMKTIVSHHNIKSNGIIAGIYGNKSMPMDTMLQLNVGTGYLSHNSERTLYDNLDADGIVNIKSKYKEAYIAPTIGLSKEFKGGKTSKIIPMIDIGYIAQHINSYTESGSHEARWSVKGRDVQTITGKVQVAIRKDTTRECANTYELRSGIKAKRQISGDEVNMNLLSTNLTFKAEGKKTYADAFFGGDFIVKPNNALSLITSAEVNKGIGNSDKNSIGASGNFGIRIKF